MNKNELLAKLTKYENENLVAMIFNDSTNNDYEYITDIDNIIERLNSMGLNDIDYSETSETNVYCNDENYNIDYNFKLLNETTIQFIYDVCNQELDNINDNMLMGLLYSESGNYNVDFDN